MSPVSTKVFRTAHTHRLMGPGRESSNGQYATSVSDGGAAPFLVAFFAGVTSTGRTRASFFRFRYVHSDPGGMRCGLPCLLCVNYWSASCALSMILEDDHQVVCHPPWVWRSVFFNLPGRVAQHLTQGALGLLEPVWIGQSFKHFFFTFRVASIVRHAEINQYAFTRSICRSTAAFRSSAGEGRVSMRERPTNHARHPRTVSPARANWSFARDASAPPDLRQRATRRFRPSSARVPGNPAGLVT